MSTVYSIYGISAELHS